MIEVCKAFMRLAAQFPHFQEHQCRAPCRFSIHFHSTILPVSVFLILIDILIRKIQSSGKEATFPSMDVIFAVIPGCFDWSIKTGENGLKGHTFDAVLLQLLCKIGGD